jgi:hypothetical protein
MSFEQLNVDDIVDVVADNQRTIGNYLGMIDSTIQVYSSMRAAGIEFENCIYQLAEQLDTEGELTEAQVNQYNSLLCHYMNKLRLYQCTKVPSENGIASKLIGDWGASNKTTSLKLSFKRTLYRWVRCKDLCSVDNMDIGACSDCPASETSVDLSIGCSTITFVNVAHGSGEAADYATFREFLCDDVPPVVHTLLSHFSKNISLLEKCVDNVNKLVDDFSLLG